MSEYKMIVLDLDGTLTDPVQGICGSVRYALEKAGRPVGPIESYHKYIGPPLLRSFGFRQTDLRRDAVGGRIASGGLRWIYPVLQWWNHYEL